MNRVRTYTFILCLLCFQFSQLVSAQQASTGYTPYSMFGIGDLTKQGTNYSQAMGGIGIGDRNLRYINTINPAAVTAMEQKSFMMDFGMRQNNVLYQANAATTAGAVSDGVVSSANNTFNLDHLVLAFPIAKKGALHFGVNTYSSVGYNFSSMENNKELLAEMGDVRYYQYGEGGLYKGFLGAGVTLFERLSLGVDGIVLFGNVSNYSTAFFSTSSNYRSMYLGHIDTYSGLGAKFGVQYNQPIGKHRSIVIGATYQLPVKLSGTAVNYAFGTSSSTDTIKYEVVDVDQRRVPSEMGVGVSYRYQDRFSAGFDYSRQDFSKTSFGETPGVEYKTCCSQSFRFGMEWTPNRYDIRYYLRRLTYRAGFYYEQQYHSLNGHQISAMGLTLGVSLPVARYFNSINIGVDLGQRGTLDHNLIRERYAMLTLGFSLHDIWFIKQLYD